jgi:hypothetical protein
LGTIFVKRPLIRLESLNNIKYIASNAKYVTTEVFFIIQNQLKICYTLAYNLEL